jgi:4-diphosphocytidyl-2-C-methyl-D-erythritol kinase
VSVASRRMITISAPAKLNLGLEILSRRADGYHDLATIYLTVSLCDELTFGESTRIELRSDDQGIAAENNLVIRAARALQERGPVRLGAKIGLRKAIPMAAGLGGASSDAASTLVAARALWRLPTSDEELALLAGQIGSDVPFFLRGGCSLGQARGEVLERLPSPDGVWFVVVAPNVSIPRKTASLYAALQAGDLSDGAKVMSQASRLRTGLDIDLDMLGNAFSRPLYERVPGLTHLPEAMRRAGAPTVALSGAGPAHYTAVGDPVMARHISDRLQANLGNAARIVVVTPTPERSILPADYDVR